MTISETIQLQTLTALQPYDTQFTLQSFDRALDVADNFQEYRITKWSFKYTPLFDTFVGGTGAAANTLPYLYSKLLAYPPPDTFGLNFLQTMGAKPRRMDDKTIVLSYKPHVLQGGLVPADTTGISSTFGTKVLRSPWLSTHNVTYSGGSSTTNMDNTPHYGHSFYIDKAGIDTAFPDVASYELNAVIEFRKPWDLKAQTPPPGTPQKIVPARKV